MLSICFTLVGPNPACLQQEHKINRLWPALAHTPGHSWWSHQFPDNFFGFTSG